VFPSKEEALDTIEKAILLYREKGKTGERFAQMVERLGFETVAEELLSGDVLSRKQEILDAKLHLTGGATC
jgi:NAD(P)H-nitrite reductase large subunit